MVGGRIIVPHRRRILRAGEAAAPSSWADWDEQSESTLDVDQDGDGNEDTFICFFENTNAGGDETGQGGGLTGSDLVLTQSGSVAGATGSPPSRQLDGTDDRFTMTDTFWDLITNKTNWSIFFKLEGHDVDTENALLDNDNLTGDRVAFRITNTNLLEGRTQDNNTWTATTDTIPSTGVFWFGVWCDGTDVRFGFSTTGKFSKWSELDSGKRVQFANPDPLDGLVRLWPFVNYQGSFHYPGKVYYIVVSKICLIDNDS